MGIQMGAKPESSFADPLGLLSDCHRRIEKFLQNLNHITQQAQGGALGGEHRHALEVALRYFREAAPRHTRDEESLFPKLRASADPVVQAAFRTIDSLEADHEIADADHMRVDELGQRWLVENTLSLDNTMRLQDALQRLQTLYQKHIAIEDNQLFPLAARVLDASTVQAVGREMAERRGIDLDTLPDLKLRCPTKRE